MTACRPAAEEQAATPTAEATATIGSNEPVRGQAMVETVDVLMLESFPVQVQVAVSGNLPDACTFIDEVITQQSGNTFRVAVTTIRQPGVACAQVVTPFEETVPLEVEGLPAGTYEVSVNGVTGSFTLDVDNTLEGQEGAPTTGAGGAGSEEPGIRGIVWHDICAQTGTAVDAAVEEEGCVPGPDGQTLQADGIFSEGEPGIPGVTVQLLAGDCTEASPGDDITVTTDESGAYSFPEVTPETYCIFLDTAGEANAAVLEEGILTYPTNNGVATNSVTVTLDENASLPDMNFGYDFRFQPLAEGAADCTNSFEFVQDLTVPDDTVFPPGAEFEAGWRLRNNGTCPWTEGYAVAFIGGDAMGITTTVPLENAVAPGETEDVAIMLTAPETPGAYRSNWQLSDAEGNVFGIDGVAEDAFWVQIIVEEGAAPVGTPAPGSAIIGGVVWDDLCFFTNNTPSAGCVETEEGSGFFRANGSFDSNESPLPGITLILGAGACPEGGIPTPANQLATTVSGEDGRYQFEGLDAGIYCVAIDALSAENVDLLIPGNWTWPAPGTGRQGIRLANGQNRQDVDFGWDFQE
jgi:hypothetical protein